MYSEILKYKPKNAFVPFLQILGWVLGLIALGFVCEALAKRYFSPIASVPYILAMALVWRIYVTQIVEYTYAVSGQTLHIIKGSGKRQSNVADVPLNALTAYADYDKAAYPKAKLCLLPGSAGRKVLVFGKENTAVVIAPSPKLDQIIQQGGCEID